MKRVNNKGKLLGWEYCGEYLVVDHGIEGMYESPKDDRDKNYVIDNLKKSLLSPNSWVHVSIKYDKEEIKRVLKYEPDSGEAKELRALGLDHEGLSSSEFVEKWVFWQRFLEHKSVRFVEYDEKMYAFCLDGLTTRDKDGGYVSKSGKPPAKAVDWYNELNQRSPHVKEE